MRRPWHPRGFYFNLMLLVSALLSITVAIVCGFQRRWAEGAFFWAQAVTLLVLLGGRTSPF